MDKLKKSANSIAVCKTITQKNTNQDACLAFDNSKAGLKGIIVADGIGSQKNSDIAANVLVASIKEQIEALSTAKDLNYEKLFREAKNALTAHVKKDLGSDFENLDKANSYGSTLICITEHTDKLSYAYAGNGGIWLIRGDFTEFSPNRFLPWNAINLLSPHTVEEAGRSALYKYLCLQDEVPYKPTMGYINKEEELPGFIFMACSDGVYSNDEQIMGKDGNNKTWIGAEPTMEFFYSRFKANLADPEIAINVETLEAFLKDYLEFLEDKKLLHDDTTLGIIISAEAINYHTNKKEENTGEKDG